MKIDVFTHILPVKYKAALDEAVTSTSTKDPGFWYSTQKVLPTLFDLDLRFRIMDKYPDLMQILTLSMPAVESLGNPQKAVDLAKLANDEMAELVLKHPFQFAGAVAALPMNDMEAALRETDRALQDLQMVGVQIYTPINGKPLDSPEFLPLYEKMSQYNLPIWIHPQKPPATPDYKGEKGSQYNVFGMLGWPYETSVAMVRLVFSGILEKFPNLKFITHHAGAMVPFFDTRISWWIESHDALGGRRDRNILRKPIRDYFKMFYADTAIYGNTPGLMCAHAFFGTDHFLFGTDMPWDNQLGLRYTRETIEAIERMQITEAEKQMIFADNARRLLRLPI